MAELVRMQALRAKLMRISSKLANHDNIPVTLFEAQQNLSWIQEVKPEISSLNSSVFSLAASMEDPSSLVAAVDEIDELIDGVCSKNCHILSMLTIDSTTKDSKMSTSLANANHIQANTSSGSNSSLNYIKLPRLELPKFSGKYEDWWSFKDQFEATIINNPKLSGCEKLKYLIGQVSDEPASLLASFSVTNDNFDSAWKLLIIRYENKREITFSLIRKILNLKPALDNAASLRKFIDTCLLSINLLSNIGRKIDHWDDMLVVIMSDKLDADIRREWSKTLIGSDMPNLQSFLLFLENHHRGLMVSTNFRPTPQSQRKAIHAASAEPTTKSKVDAAKETTKFTCHGCGDNHALYKCQVFNNMTIQDRVSLVKKKHLCFNCLTPGHSVDKCRSLYKCKTCAGKHHSLIHREIPSKQEVPNQTGSQGQHDSNSSSNHASGIGVLLATAIILVQDSTGSCQECRAFLDSGSESSFISDQCVKRLGLRRCRCDINITGVGSSSICRAKGQVDIHLKSRINDFSINANALILPKVTGNLPSFNVGSNHKRWGHIQGLVLADPQFFHPNEVDILIGAASTQRIFTGSRILGGIDEPVACDSEFGWIIVGPVGIGCYTAVNSHSSVRVHSTFHHETQLLQKFWEIESVSPCINYTAEEKLAEHFISNHFRQENGRYVVPLPTNDNLSKLGNSREVAECRFLSTERRLNRNLHFKSQYVEFMEEYLRLGHMVEPSKIEDAKNNHTRNFYLPHHFVTKDESSTTKLRVVFDGSCKSSTGFSLNDCLLVGPTVQPTLFTHLLQFRTFNVVLKADITKMYRQFSVPLQDSNLQRILWRSNSLEEIKEFNLLTVTYGTASAPFSATRCLAQLAVDEGKQFPLAAASIQNNFYADDLLSGADTSDQAFDLFQELQSITAKAGLELRKFSSNSNELISRIPVDLVEASLKLNVTKDSVSKALGVRWDTTTDVLTFGQLRFDQTANFTRRSVLSQMSQVFDPIGFLAPFTISIKIYFQLLWTRTRGDGSNLSWDDPIPEDLVQRWLELSGSFMELDSVKVPRSFLLKNPVTCELHGFSDASEQAYAGVVYLKSVDASGTVQVRLVAAKTKVAPLKAVSLPRLELSGALLLVRLISGIISSLKFSFSIHCWSDSEIVLHWISNPSRKWNTFVANRVSELQQLVPIEQWHFIPGKLNPADCASRGHSLKELLESSIWWNGADFLQKSAIPCFEKEHNFNKNLEVKTSKIKVHAATFIEQITSRFSSYNKLLRAFVYVLRFIQLSKGSPKVNCLPTASELKTSRNKLILMCQLENFPEEIRLLKLGKTVQGSNKLTSLTPFIDSNGLIRIGGRLENALVPFETRHPIILDGRTRYSKLLITHLHQQFHHAGEKLLSSIIRTEYWIVHGRSTINDTIHKCLTCKKAKGLVANQLMGQLPSARVRISTPFQHTGVDYGGPVMLQTITGRRKTRFKGYLCLFICLATKAVHLEPVTSLATDSFIATFKRFISRRGKPSDIYSDHGSNFKGASELLRLLCSKVFNDSVSSFLAAEGTTWHFIPPAAPHHGGLWEAGIKSTKFHLTRIIGQTTITLEEFATILCQIEAVLNSRPLTALSSNVDDWNALTPGHFLIGKPLLSLPQENLTTSPDNRLSRWKRQEKITQVFWNRWSQEYLNTLQQRSKWRKPCKNVQIEDLVALKEDHLPPLKWKLARVIQIYPGNDDLVRSVKVSTSTSTFLRPIVKIVPLLTSEELNFPFDTLNKSVVEAK